ncbi:hypothetical protein GGI35DRAFT_339120 [Trichoderma velutinum]
MYYGVFSISPMISSSYFLFVAAFIKSRSSANPLPINACESFGEEGTINTRLRLLENECGIQARVSLRNRGDMRLCFFFLFLFPSFLFFLLGRQVRHFTPNSDRPN